MTIQLQQIVDTLAAGVSATKNSPIVAVQTAYDRLIEHVTATYSGVSVRSLLRRPNSADVRELLVEDLVDASAADDPALAQLALDLRDALTEHAPDAGQTVGVDLSNISAKSLKIAGVQSDGTGVRINQAEIAEDASIRDVTAGDGKELATNASRQAVDISNTNVGGNLTIGPDKASEEAAARLAYLREVASECNLLPWTTVHTTFSDPDQEDEMGLADIYTDLDTTDLREVKREEELRQMMRAMHAVERIAAQEVTNEFERLLLMGDPGSGKSTFVKHLAYTLAKGGPSTKAQGPPSTGLAVLGAIEPWDHGALLPVRIELRQVAAFARQHEVAKGDVGLLRRYMAVRLDEMGQNDFGPQMDRLLQRATGTPADNEDAALFLLDGLDEVPTDQRQLVVDMVNDISKRLPRHRYLVTCRPYAYVGQPWQLSNFHPTSLAPFSRGQIDRFVTNWYRRMAERGRMDRAESDDRLQRLQRALEERTDLLGLAERPLLLTVMAQLHTFKNQLPDSRVELYKDAVELLLQRWEAREGKQDTLLQQVDLPGLAMGTLQAALYEVAYNAHAQHSDEESEETADIDEGDLRKWIAPYLRDDWNKAGVFIDYIRERAGLLIRHKTEAYTFPHRTFQEYLAACHLIESDDFPTTAAELVAGDRSRWREVFVLAVGQAPLGQAIAAVNALCPKAIEANSEDEPDEEAWQMALLAGEALNEIGRDKLAGRPIGAVALENVCTSLIGASQALDLLKPKERAAGGRLLGRLGDPRPELTMLAQMPLCHVPAGPFRMGAAEDDELAEENEKPIHTLDLAYDFWIGQTPITCAQFAEFSTEENYKNAALWTEAAAAGRWEDGALRGFLYEFDRDKDEWEWNERTLTKPYDRGEPWTLPNHPRVDINWYEALAFCRWLTQKAHTDSWLDTDYCIHLPSEAEWEKTARGGLEIPTAPRMLPLEGLSTTQINAPQMQKNPLPKRLYPSGDEWDSTQLNCYEGDVEHATPFGCFGGQQNPYGVEEMAGNVLDWTRSLWGKEVETPEFGYKYDPRDGREALDADDDMGRILRGGSWGSEQKWNRSSARNWDNPFCRNYLIGFRLSVVPTSLCS